MTPRLRNILYAIFTLVAVLGVAKCQHDASQRALGESGRKLFVAESTLAVVRAEGRKIDSVFVVDTLRLTRRIETVSTLLDTLRLSDTVTLTRRESVLVFVADSLVQNCRDTLNSCAQRIGNLNEQLSLTSQQRDVWRKRASPSLWDQIKQLPSKAVTSTALMSVGYMACKVGGL